MAPAARSSTAAFGFECAGRDACHRAGGVEPGEYGRIVRIDLDSLDRSFNFETHYIRGLAKTRARVGLALAVMMALALGPATPSGCARW